MDSNEIDVCLISVGWFTQAQDMEVSFDKHSCKLKYKDTIVLEGVYDDSLGMYTLDMLELITAPDPRIAKELQVDQCYAARRVQRFRQAVVIKALALHRHTGCLPFETMAICIERKAWGGIDPGITPALCRELGRKKACLVCALCRWLQEVFEVTGIKPSYSKKDIGKYIVTDCGGKVTPASYGNHYFQYVGCPLIKHHRVYGQKGKDGESLGSIRLWLIYALQHGHTPQYLLTDGGSEVESDMASELYARWGIKCIPTPGKIPLFSAEREMQLKYDDIEALLLSVQTWTASNWLDAAIHSAQMRSYTFNSSSVLLSESETPFELWTGQKPPLDCFSRYGAGSIVVAETPTIERRVGQSRQQMGLVLTIRDDGSRAADLDIPGKKKVVDRGHLQKVNISLPSTPRTVSLSWNEDKSEAVLVTSDNIDTSSVQGVLEFQNKVELMKLAEEEARIKAAEPRLQLIEQEATICDLVQLAQAADPLSPEVESLADARIYLRSSDPHRGYFEDEATAFLASHDPGGRKAASHSFWTRVVDDGHYKYMSNESVRDIHTFFLIYGCYPDLSERGESVAAFVREEHPKSDLSPDEVEDEDEGNLFTPSFSHEPHAFRCFAARSLSRNHDETPSLTRIMRDPALQQQWLKAMRSESVGWLEHARHITRERALEIGVTPHVTTFTTKRGTGARKARITFHGGFELRNNPEFREHRYRLYAPAMDSDLLLFLIAFSTYFRMRRFSADVTQCFMHNDMKNATFKRALVVLLNQWECGIVGGAYLEIDSVIYGCPDASMEWHKRIRSFMLEEVGMSVSVFHPCLFVHWVDPISLILIGIATDNIEFFFTDTSGAITKVEGIVRQLEGKWPMTFEEEAKDILGMSFDRQSDGSEQVTQPGTMKAVERFFFPSGYAPKMSLRIDEFFVHVRSSITWRYVVYSGIMHLVGVHKALSGLQTPICISSLCQTLCLGLSMLMCGRT